MLALSELLLKLKVTVKPMGSSLTKTAEECFREVERLVEFLQGVLHDPRLPLYLM